MLTIKEIASFVNGEIIGDSNFIIKGACNLKGGKKYHISYLANPKYRQYLKNTEASVVIIQKDFEVINKNKIFIKVNDPKISFAKVLNRLKPETNLTHQISQTAIIHKTVKLGKNIHIGENVVIKNNVTIHNNSIIRSGTVILDNSQIGSNAYLGPNVTIYSDTIIGNNVHIDAGSVLGADGFGWSTSNNKQIKIPQIGNVIVENNVWIGANCCIDRATFESTIIGSGTKMDNLIQIAHNVIIGKNCLIAGGVAIAGSTIIGDNVTIAGQVGIIDHIKIDNDTIIAAKSGVFKSFNSGSFISGIPARNHTDRIRQDILISKLPEIQKKIKVLEKIIKNKGNKIG